MLCQTHRRRQPAGGTGQGVQLTWLRVYLVNDAVAVDLAIEDSGFCRSATAEASASLALRIESGSLVDDVTVSDPSVDTDVPCYCYLAAAVMGVLTGGLIDFAWGVAAAVVGAIVGGVLAALPFWLTVGAIESAVNDAVDAVVDAINQPDPTHDLPDLGVDLKSIGC